MSSNDNGGYVYPGIYQGETRSDMPGLALRDYLAAKAMQGFLSNAWQAQQLDETGDSSREQMAIVAEISYVMADSMIAERERNIGAIG